VLLSSLTVLSLFDLDVPETFALYLFLLGNHLFGARQLVVSLELPIKVSLMHAVFTVDVSNSLLVTLSSHVLYMRVIHVTLHVIDRVLEMGVGCGRVAVEWLIYIS
jgi:hypothetical protein